MPEGGKPWRPGPGGLTVRVRVTPRSSLDRIEGTMETRDGPALKVRVRAVPENGEANAAVVRLLAERAGVASSKIELVGGAAARIKLFFIAGEPSALGAKLDTGDA